MGMFESWSISIRQASVPGLMRLQRIPGSERSRIKLLSRATGFLHGNLFEHFGKGFMVGPETAHVASYQLLSRGADKRHRSELKRAGQYGLVRYDPLTTHCGID
jgi:hypothetical protein